MSVGCKRPATKTNDLKYAATGIYLVSVACSHSNNAHKKWHHVWQMEGSMVMHVLTRLVLTVPPSV